MKKVITYASLVSALTFINQSFGDSEMGAKLRALSSIESDNNDNAIGSKGERSRWQIRRSVWKQHFPGGGDGRGYMPFARDCALLHITWLEEQYRKYAKRNPSASQLYCMWNMGWAGFKRRDCLVSKCPAVVQERAERFANLYSEYVNESKKK